MPKTRRSLTPPPPPQPLGKSRAAVWRQGLKENNPEKYHEYLLKERKRNRENRENMSNEKKNECRMKTKSRVQLWREKKKNDKPKTNRVLFESKINDMSASERKEYNKIRQREHRSHMSHQKKTKVKQREKKRRMRKKEAMKSCTSTDLNSKNKIRVNAHRLKKFLPKNAINFAEAITHIVKNSPRKLNAMKSVRDKFSESLDVALKSAIRQIKRKRNYAARTELATYHTLHNIAAKAAKRKAIKIVHSLKRLRSSKVHLPLIFDFYRRGDISRPIPRSKDVKRGQVTYLMETTINDAYARYVKENGSSISYRTFARHRPKDVKLCNGNDLITCQCEICVNVLQKLNTLRRITCQIQIKNPELPLPKIPASVHSINKQTLCENPTLDCHVRSCANCGVIKVRQYFELFMEPALRSTVVSWLRYEKTEKERKVYKDNELQTNVKATKEYVKHENHIGSLLEELFIELESFSLHLYNAYYQLNQFNTLIDNLPEGWLVSVQDFSENYSVKYQLEPQSSYWDKTAMTLHPSVVFYREEGQLVREGITLVTEDLLHDHGAVWSFRKKVLDHLNDKSFVYHVGWSDGCAAQYKSRAPFLDCSFSEADFGIVYEHNFYGSRHAKGPSDAEGAVLKNWVTRQVSHGALVRDAREFVELCKSMPQSDNSQKSKFHTRRTIIYVDPQELADDRAFLKKRGTAITVVGTRKLHQIRSTDYPGFIYVRNRSCYCKFCLNHNFSMCENKSESGQFEMVSLLNKDSNTPKPKACTDNLSLTHEASSISNLSTVLGSWVAAIYDDDIYIGEVTEIQSNLNTVKWMRPHGKNKFKWPDKPDIMTVPFNELLGVLKTPPEPLGHRMVFSMTETDSKIMYKLLEKVLNP